MTTIFGLGALKWTGASVFFVCAAIAAYVVQTDRESSIHRCYSLYVAYLERKLRNMLLPAHGRAIVACQLLGLAVTSFGLFTPIGQWAMLTVPLVLFCPALYLEYARRSRVARIERTVDSFIMALANALRAAPSIGNGLSYSQSVVAGPIKEELGLVLQELRLGNSVDQALLNMGGRIQSEPLDSALAALLIGRQVGGDLVKVLETTGATLRELGRLQGVLRSKTAESRAQMWTMAVFPVVMVFGFDWLSPGYFQPLFDSWIGWVIMTLAALLWTGSVVASQRVLAVGL